MEKLRTIFEYKLTNDGAHFFFVIGKKTLKEVLREVWVSRRDWLVKKDTAIAVSLYRLTPTEKN